ncbi:MAG TPA: hypothetical protein VMK05_11335 [Burkholderiales bacterium]|nr:hypothetical protein [Burkholderiales bacterium]
MSAYAKKLAITAIVAVAAFSGYSLSTTQTATAQSTLSSTPYFPDGYVNQASEPAQVVPTF